MAAGFCLDAVVVSEAACRVVFYETGGVVTTLAFGFETEPAYTSMTVDEAEVFVIDGANAVIIGALIISELYL